MSPIIALTLANPELVDTPGGQDSQRDIKRLSLTAAMDMMPGNEKSRIRIYERQTLSGGEKDGRGEMEISAPGEIKAERNIQLNPISMQLPTFDVICAWYHRYLPSTATDREIEQARKATDQICQSAGWQCPDGQRPACDLQARKFAG